MTTHKLAPSALVCVPAAERKRYAKIGSELLVHPDSVKGLAAKRNWILEKLKAEASIVMLDDDLAAMVRLWMPPREGVAHVKDPATVLQLVHQAAALAVEAGCYLFGWQSGVHPEYYSGHKPFSLTGAVNGCAFGLNRGHGLRFDERITAKEDFDISAQNAYRHHKCFRDLRFAWAQKDTFHNAGGQAAYRNSSTEDRDVAILKAKWGPAIHCPKAGGAGPRKAAYVGARKVELRLPF